jgi:hypothetical protein
MKVFDNVPPMARKVFWLFWMVLLFPVDAFAGGTYVIRSTTVQESGGQWHIYLRIDLPSAPAIPHMPMKFMFTEQTMFERALTDNSKDPVMNRQPIQNALPKTESLDVDFADGTGKIFKSTRYDFSLTRARGYEAGEYQFKLRTSDGTDVGGTTNITLQGDNPVVDRRSITFATKVTAKKDAGTEVADNTANIASTEVTPVGTAPPFVPPDAFKKTPEEEQVHTQGGGCCGGSMIASTAPTSNAAIIGLTLGVGLFVVRRRRK